MSTSMPRRAFLSAAPALAATTLLATGRAMAQPAGATTAAPAIPPAFPSQDPGRVREMVGVSHGNVTRVKELLAESPALAKATWDWGFGDWETALGAASHMGNREIAGLLIENGARPDLFTFAMLGQLAVVKAYIEANAGIQKTPGPHGLTLLHHARKGGPESQAVVDYLLGVGDADLAPQSQPLSDDAMNACVGNYAFASGEDGTLAVSIKDGMLWIKRLPDGTSRSLFHLGDRVFHPVGAPAVRVRFTGDGPPVAGLVIVDGPSTLTARKSTG